MKASCSKHREYRQEILKKPNLLDSLCQTLLFQTNHDLFAFENQVFSDEVNFGTGTFQALLVLRKIIQRSLKQKENRNTQILRNKNTLKKIEMMLIKTKQVAPRLGFGKERKFICF